MSSDSQAPAEETKAVIPPIVLSGSYVEDYAIQKLIEDMGPQRQTVRLLKLRSKPMVVRIVGAAAGELGDIKKPEDIERAGDRLREMTDPYNSVTRNKFTDAAHQDPRLSEGLEKRQAAFFKDGFTLKLELKSRVEKKPEQSETNKANEGEQTGSPSIPDNEEIVGSAGPAQQMAPPELKPAPPTNNLGLQKAQEKLEEKKAEEDELTKASAPYLEHLQTLLDWAEKPEIDVLGEMKGSLVASVVQGKTMTLITPGIESLAKGALPTSLVQVHTEEMGNPIVDTRTRRMVAVRVNQMEPLTIAMPDQYVYITRREWGLRRESQYHGASPFEAILIVSQAWRKLINYDMLKAQIRAHLSQLIITAQVQGLSPEQRRVYLDGIMTRFKTHGTDYITVEFGTEVKAVPVEIDKEAMELISNTYQELLMSTSGTTKSQMNKTEGLTRDNATIQEQVFNDFTRDPDEKLIKSAYEAKVFNPLLAHLAGEEFEEIPVKVCIVRKEPEKPKSSIASKQDYLGDTGDNPNMDVGRNNGSAPLDRQRRLQAQKAQDIKQGSTFGSSGLSEEDRELLREDIQVKRDLVKALNNNRGQAFRDVADNQSNT